MVHWESINKCNRILLIIAAVNLPCNVSFLCCNHSFSFRVGPFIFSSMQKFLHWMHNFMVWLWQILDLFCALTPLDFQLALIHILISTNIFLLYFFLHHTFMLTPCLVHSSLSVVYISFSLGDFVTRPYIRLIVMPPMQLALCVSKL